MDISLNAEIFAMVMAMVTVMVGKDDDKVLTPLCLKPLSDFAPLWLVMLVWGGAGVEHLKEHHLLQSETLISLFSNVREASSTSQMF